MSALSLRLRWVNQTFTANVSSSEQKRLFRNVERSRNIKTEEPFSLF